MPRSILLVGRMWFLTRCWSCTNQQGKACPGLPPFVFEGEMIDITIREHSKSTTSFLKKKRSRLCVFFCTYVFVVQIRTRLKFQIETRKIKIEQGIEVLPLVLITTRLMYRNCFLAISLNGWRTRQCNWYRSSPCVFKFVYTKFHLDREGRFAELYSTDFRPKKWPKMVILSFVGYVG